MSAEAWNTGVQIPCEGCGAKAFAPQGCRATSYRCRACGGTGVHDQISCGTCGAEWCDGCDPTPAARCLFEHEHGDGPSECPDGCGAVRTVSDGDAFPAHPDLRAAVRGRFRWCAGGDASGAIVAVEPTRGRCTVNAAVASITAPSGARATVRWTSRDSDGRNGYAWTLADGKGAVVATGWTLRSSVGADIDAWCMLETLGSFLGAWVESLAYPHSDNRDLFPAAAEAVASELHDEIAMTLTDENGDYVAPFQP